MWFAASLVDSKKKAEEEGTRAEIKVMFNADNIKMLVENKEEPDTTMVAFRDGTPNALIKGSYEQNSKILYGFNRK